MKIGAQLYTLREFTGTREGFVSAMDRLAEMGYEGVQLSAVGCMGGDSPLVSVEEAAGILRERGLICAATHRSWEDLRDRTAAEIEFHRVLGCGYAAIGVPPAGVREGGLGGFREWLGEARGVSDQLLAGGVTFGYHNHALEFERMEGGRPFDVLVEEAPWLAMELDTYWVQAAGADVVGTIERLEGRLPVVHVKDMAAFGWEVDFAPVGEGNLDWGRILPAFAAAGTEWVLVEQDSCRRDAFECLASSLGFLRGVLG